MALLFACMGAAAADTTFEGTENPDSSFDPAHVVTLEMAYKYSNTGGLAGVNVAAPQKVKAVATLLDDRGTPDDPKDDTYRVSLALPTTPAGFRVVLDPAELNQYVVSPPTGTESADQLADKLENGDFNVDIDHHTVYYWQEIKSADHTVQHPDYRNQYSTEYNGAWNAARWIEDPDRQTGYRAEAVCGNSTHPSGAENHGANMLVDPRLEVTLTQAQLENAQAQGLSITVYYRRNATWYTVNHWVPEHLSGLDDSTGYPTKTVGNVKYVRLNQETLQGRVGATTNAEAKNDGVYTLLSPVGFSQKLIAQQDTVVDIDYKAAHAYRVIFDTDYTYIPRQTVELGKAVDFMRITTEPTRTGYNFAGWRYLKLKQGEKPDANGEYSAGQYEYTDVNWNSSNNNYELTIDDGLVKSAKIVNIDGVPALHLYPKWTPDKTTVRVILWTEDLTGTDDVYAQVTKGTADYYTKKYAKYSNQPKTHDPNLQASNPNYSNVGSFTVEVETDSRLVKDADHLLDGIQTDVAREFGTAMGDVDGIAVNQFYRQKAFQIVHEKADDEIEYGVTEASADGKTTINVFFTRNIYELRFHYYGFVGGNTNYAVAYSTNGYSWGGIEEPYELIKQGELDFGYEGGDEKWINQNEWAYVDKGLTMPVPETITIRAKYGADLREVWPVAQYNEWVTADTPQGIKDTRMISWATTQGKYCADGLYDAPATSKHKGEATIMGVYAAMGSEIIADPSVPAKVHHLVAYWHWNPNSYYRYNHCYEVPDLKIEESQYVKLPLTKDKNDDDLRNLLFLVPSGNKAFAGYQDLMPVSYNKATDTVTYDVANGGFYAVRGYQKDGGDIKYYAVSKRVEVMSTNKIEKQNPSARLHMTRVNTNPDHTTEHKDDEGNTNGGTAVGKEGAPYDLYFYYDRDCYTITYMAPCNAENSPNTEVTLGTIELPYGALVTEEKYGFELYYEDKNTNIKYPWKLNKLPEVSVCPDRSENGTAKWKFRGWALGPAGVNMQWDKQNKDVQAQAGENFYIEGNLRLYAIWDVPDYTVTFHLEGGSVATGDDPVVQKIPANTRYSASGAIPRPTRQGYTFLGWFNAKQGGTAFNFDLNITKDWDVYAQWEAETEKKFHYRVYYVTDNPLPADKSKETEEIDGKLYYVLDEVEHPNVPYAAGMVLNLSPVAIEGYVPQSTDALLTPDPALDSTDWDKVVFCYDPITAHRHRVQFVEAGTEKKYPPTVIHERQTEVEADVLAVTPSAEDVTELLNKGYGLVNRQNDNSYAFVTEYEQLTWIDENNVVQPYQNLSGEDIPDVITYLVSKIPYTVTYKNAPGSPAAAQTELNAITAAENTTPDSANGKNPTLYHKGDAFTIRNPQRVHDATNGKWYQFAYWTLDNGTNVAANSPDKPTQFNPLSVAAGTTGNLTFVANWTDTDVGSLTVSKKVEGNPPNPDEAFTFAVKTPNDSALSGTYGEMEFKSGEAVFTLKNGESKTATGLPVGLSYEVTESKAENYTPASTNATGTIEKGMTKTAVFTNTYVEPKPDVPKTDVTITKIWNDAGYTGRPSAFTIHVTAEDDPTFSYTKVIKRDDVSVVVSPDGNTWTFKASWNVHSYRIEELDVPGYVSSVSGENNRFVITNTYMPKTGDRTHLLRNVLLLCCGVALVAAAGLVIDKKRR